MAAEKGGGYRGQQSEQSESKSEAKGNRKGKQKGQKGNAATPKGRGSKSSQRRDREEKRIEKSEVKEQRAYPAFQPCAGVMAKINKGKKKGQSVSHDWRCFLSIFLHRLVVTVGWVCGSVRDSAAGSYQQ